MFSMYPPCLDTARLRRPTTPSSGKLDKRRIPRLRWVNPNIPKNLVKVGLRVVPTGKPLRKYKIISRDVSRRLIIKHLLQKPRLDGETRTTRMFNSIKKRRSQSVSTRKFLYLNLKIVLFSHWEGGYACAAIFLFRSNTWQKQQMMFSIK